MTNTKGLLAVETNVTVLVVLQGVDLYNTDPVKPENLGLNSNKPILFFDVVPLYRKNALSFHPTDIRCAKIYFKQNIAHMLCKETR